MRLPTAITAFGFVATAFAQQAPLMAPGGSTALDAFNKCVIDYATAHARVDASASDIATAGLVACYDVFVKTETMLSFGRYPAGDTSRVPDKDKESARERGIYAVVEARSKPKGK